MKRHDFVPDSENTRAFRDALGCFPTGVTLVTIASEKGPMGFVANSFSAVSLTPPLVLWSPARASRRFVHFETARNFAIHVLPRQSEEWIQRFSGDGAGFDGLDPVINAQGVPVLADALARFDCEQHATHDGGDHLIIVGRVLRAARNEGVPLVFSQGAYGEFSITG